MQELVFVDTETTGLDSSRHELFELALIRRKPGHEDEEQAWWFPPLDLSTADPNALIFNNYYERRACAKRSGPDAEWVSRDEYVSEIHYLARALHGQTLAGANPHFDAGFLRAMMLKAQTVPTWHHRLIDVESMAIPILGLEKPMGVSDLAEKLEIEIKDRHTALGDCRAHRDIYDKLIEIGNELRGHDG
jgi:DNA polymerase III epsilon subunit-like protein